MDKRIATAVATGAVVALPLLAGCGASSAPQGSPAAPTASSAAAPSTTAAAPSAEPSASASPSASSDPAAEKKNVQDATEKFVKTALTIGYPDASYSDYLKRVKPLMTSSGFKQLSKATSSKEADKELKTLRAQHARSTPKIKSDKVTSVTADKAAVKVSYQLLAQQQSGGGWKTLKTPSTDSNTFKLVHDGDEWLVDDVSS